MPPTPATLDAPATSPESPAPDGPTPAASAHAYDTGLLLLRVVLGLTIAAHGSQKLFGWFGGLGLDGIGKAFTGMGYPAGRTMAAIAGITEMLGGIGLVLGLITPLAGAAVFGTMVNAIVVDANGGFFLPKGVEYAVLLAAGAAALALTGPGRYAVDRVLPGLRAHRLAYGVAALLLGAVLAAGTLLIRH
ncbi:DoxX family protein [Streptomyces botrytidirepellens]|uniref:DoxX family protein n=1 Tax=Streptomyces botrytidirepellens TaxID=2486417 RepID=A0A3M8W012_9ACTN|nr:DoxX family protein [Streptomyces botrytidirepellens]RNG21263.1 DoxX family protein [Streptomyces botrytidirepellens]